MKGYNKWNYKPLVETREKPYICMLSPYEKGAVIQYTPANEESEITIFYKKREGSGWNSVKATSNPFDLDCLEERYEYEIYLEDNYGNKGTKRIFATGFYPGKVINYLHFQDKQYIFSGRCVGSPSIIRLPSGALLAAHDIFCGGRGGTPENFTMVFRSDDDGENWTMIAELLPSFWPRLFVHKDKVYIIACSRTYGDVLVGCSEDEGKTWSTPTVLGRGCCMSGDYMGFSNIGFHKGSCQMLKYNGRIWFAMEYGSWGAGFRNTLLSVDENAELLDADNWTFTSVVPAVKDVDGVKKGVPGSLEGVPLVSEDGKYIYDIARYSNGKAMVLRVPADEPEGDLEFYKFINLPVGHSKFELYQQNDGWIYALGNKLPLRNVVAVYRSKNLEEWEFVQDVVNYQEYDESKVALQYPGGLLEGRKLYMVSRTAFNGSEDFHDSNCMTFHKFELNI